MTQPASREPRSGEDAPYEQVATARAHRFDGWRDLIYSLPAHASTFELAGACAADIASDPMNDRCAYDRRILLVTLDSALAALAAAPSPGPDLDTLRAERDAITEDYEALVAEHDRCSPGPDLREATLDVERLAKMRDLIVEWLDAERLLDTMNIDDGPAHQDAWDAVHWTREQLAAEYAALSATPRTEASDE